MDDLISKFYDRISHEDSNGCWIWNGNKMTTGYGRLDTGKIVYHAHRLSYMIHHEIIQDGLVVRHKCDNRICVNPKHLEIGTHHDNAIDREERHEDYHLRGEEHPKAKLTQIQINDIRSRYKRGNGKILAQEYNVSTATISYIINYKKWV